MGILARMESRATTVLENPQKPLTESNLIAALGGEETYSGANVNERSGMKLAVVYACVRVLSESLAALPLPLYRRIDNDGRQRATDHPLYRILHDRPNPELSSFHFRELLEAHRLTWGNAFAEIERNGAGQVLALWPLMPDRTYAARIDGRRVVITQVNGERVVIPAENVLHIPGLGYDGLNGYSPIRMAQQAIGIGLAAEEYSARWFSGGARPSAIVTHPSTLSKQASDRIRESLEQNMTGLTQAHRLAVLEEGMRMERWGVPADEAQFLETQVKQAEQIARIYRVPPHKVGLLERCMPADTMVYSKGGPKRIADVLPDDEVWSPTERGPRLRKVLNRWDNGVRETLEIRTTNRAVRCTSNHRLLVRRSHERPLKPGEIGGRNVGGVKRRVVWRDEYVEAGDLRIGDTLVTLSGLPDRGLDETPTGRQLTTGFMEFCGLLLADGNISYQRGKPSHVAIARADHARYMPHYRSVMTHEFRRYRGGNGRGNQALVPRAPVTLVEAVRATVFASVLEAQALLDMGFGGTAYTKRVPGWVFEAAKEFRLAFLRGFLDGDGTVDTKGRIAYFSANKLLLEDLRHLCMGVGVPVTNVRSDVNSEAAYGDGTRMWRFTCSDPGANAQIGSHDDRYVKRLSAGKPFNRKDRAYPRFGGKEPTSSGLSLARIVAIEPCPAEPVFDIEVEGEHCFFADGVVSHNSTNNNIEHQDIEFVRDTLLPNARRWEQPIQHTLLSDRDRSTYFAEFLFEALLRGDSETRHEVYAKGRQWGYMSANDVRRLENMNPIPGGDVYMMPVNMIPSDQAGMLLEGGGNDDEGGDGDDDGEPMGGLGGARSVKRIIGIEARRRRSALSRQRLRAVYEKLFIRAAERFVGVEVKAVLRMLKRAVTDSGLDFQRFLEELEPFYARLSDDVRDELLPILIAFGEVLRNELADELAADQEDIPVGPFATGYADRVGTLHVKSSQDQIAALARDTEPDLLAGALEERFNGWGETRATKVGRWESVNFGGAFALAAYSALGIITIRWMATGKSCPLCQSLNGRVTTVKGHFLRDGDQVDPQDGKTSPMQVKRFIRHPPLHDGCDCTVVSD